MIFRDLSVYFKNCAFSSAHLRTLFSTLSDNYIREMLLVQACPSFCAAVLSSHIACDIPLFPIRTLISEWRYGCITNRSSYIYCPCCPSTEITASQSPRQCVLCHSTKPTLFAAVWSGLSHPPMRTLLWWLVGYLCL